MKTLRKEIIESIYIDSLPVKEKMEQGRIYISKKFNGSSHLCLCGCGMECYLPISKGEWELTDDNGKITITPSIQQRFSCESHYIITKGIANFV